VLFVLFVVKTSHPPPAFFIIIIITIHHLSSDRLKTDGRTWLRKTEAGRLSHFFDRVGPFNGIEESAIVIVAEPSRLCSPA